MGSLDSQKKNNFPSLFLSSQESTTCVSRFVDVKFAGKVSRDAMGGQMQESSAQCHSERERAKCSVTRDSR